MGRLAHESRVVSGLSLENRAHMNISLIFDTHARHYEDEHGIFYPKEIDLLVIVQTKKFAPGSSFPFQLHLESDITVDVHTSRFNISEIVRLYTERRPGHKGWVFNIRGKFEPSLAKDALRRAKEDSNTIGLSPPMREWRDRQKAQ
jgi:hypothetical protein